MIRFECDYAEGAHPRVLERLMETNLEQTPGMERMPIVTRPGLICAGFARMRAWMSISWWAVPR